MKEITLEVIPFCFEKWCKQFEDLLRTNAQRKGFRYYLAGLLGESKGKNITQITDNIIDSTYNNVHHVHHFISNAKWDVQSINDRRLKILNKCKQTRIQRNFALIIDDSGHRKSGNFTDGVGKQYLGEIGKTENGIVIVTTHLYDGVRSIPLDVELYQHASSLPNGKADENFLKKPDLALKLIEKTLERKYHPGIVLMDGGYGNNWSFLRQLETLKLKYIGGLAKNRLVSIINTETGLKEEEKRLEEVILSIPKGSFKSVTLKFEQQKILWVTTIEEEIKELDGQRKIAIVMNANSPEKATEIDYLITNKEGINITGEWIVTTFSQRSYIEKFYREAKQWLGLKEYQTRKKSCLIRHFVLVFCAYTFIIYQQLMGGLRKRYAHKPLTTFAETLEAFLTGISYSFFNWLQKNQEFFANYKGSQGFIWG